MSNRKDTKRQVSPCQLELFSTTKALPVVNEQPVYCKQNICINYSVSSEQPTNNGTVIISLADFKNKQKITNFYEEINKLTSHIQ